MGHFTWTLANKKREYNKHGDYKEKCKLRYWGRGVVVCPDDTHIEETAYNGYGIFNGQDVYDLVVDWNKQYLRDIYHDLPAITGKDNYWGKELRDVAFAFQDDDMEKVQRLLHDLVGNGMYGDFIYMDWKRNIGITIACEDKKVMRIPYPIKIVDNVRIRPYKDLGLSFSCQ